MIKIDETDRIFQNAIEKMTDEKVRDYSRSYRKHLVAVKKYQKDNPEKMRAINKRYRENNPEKMRAINKRYVKNNPEKIKEIQRRYYKKNRVKILEQKRKARLKQNE